MKLGGSLRDLANEVRINRTPDDTISPTVQTSPIVRGSAKITLFINPPYNANSIVSIIANPSTGIIIAVLETLLYM